MITKTACDFYNDYEPYFEKDAGLVQGVKGAWNGLRSAFGFPVKQPSLWNRFTNGITNLGNKAVKGVSNGIGKVKQMGHDWNVGRQATAKARAVAGEEMNALRQSHANEMSQLNQRFMAQADELNALKAQQAARQAANGTVGGWMQNNWKPMALGAAGVGAGVYAGNRLFGPRY